MAALVGLFFFDKCMWYLPAAWLLSLDYDCTCSAVLW
jgi:hypothetical protein